MQTKSEWSPGSALNGDVMSGWRPFGKVILGEFAGSPNWADMPHDSTAS